MSDGLSLDNLPLTNSGWNLKTSRDGAPTGYEGFRAVVVGGGTGAPVSIKTLLGMGVHTSVVVAMADDGGSTGRLRERSNIIPPGDIRKCLTAMAADSEDPLVEAFRYRFDYVNNHTLGNLVLTALADVTSFTQAVTICERLLNCLGNVYPSTLDPITLEGVTRDGRMLHGQSTIVHSATALERVWLSPENPVPYRPALQAIRQADLIVLGPGSLFTSIIPNLLVPGVVDAIRDSGAKTVFLCSVADVQGETWGLDCFEHVDALLKHGMQDLLHAVCINSVRKEPGTSTTGEMVALGKLDPATLRAKEFESVSNRSHPEQAKSRAIRRVACDSEIVARIGNVVPMVMEKQLADPVLPTWHSPRVLGDVFKGVLDLCRSQAK